MPRRFFSPWTPDPLWLWRAALVPALAWFATSALAQAHGDLAARAELRFLGLMSALCLVCIGALVPKKPLVEWTAAATLFASWGLAESAVRGSVTSTLLLTAVGAAAFQAMKERKQVAKEGGENRPLTLTALFTATLTAWQVLVRPDLLLAPLLDPRTLVSVGILPLLGGLSLARLAKAYGEKTAWISGLAVAVVAPGFNVTVTMALVAAAAGSFLAQESSSPFLRRAAPAAILGASLIAWPLSLPVALSGFARVLTDRLRLGAATAALAIFVAANGLADPSVDMAALALILLPWGLLSFDMTSLDRSVRWLLGLLLIGAAAAAGGDPESLAPGLLVLATVIRIDRSLQLWLSLTVAAGVGLYAAYPWLHTDPLLLIERPWVPGVAIVALASISRLAHGLRFKPHAAAPPLPVLIFGLAALASLFFAPAAPLAVLQAPRVLDQNQPESLWELPGETDLPVARALVDSNMVHGAHLETHTKVASLELLDAKGVVVATAEILAGEHTADWAAGRPDIAALGFTVPEPFSKRPSPDRSFFEQRYRADLELKTAPGIAAIRIRRNSDLPPLTRLVIRRVELRS